MTLDRRPDAAALPAGVSPGGRFRSWQPRAVRYVVCDVDGTLVGPGAGASDAVAAAVTAAQDDGLAVGFATGRMRAAVAPLQTQLQASGPHVLHNGAEVRADGVTLKAWPLTARDVDALLAIAHGRDDCYLEVYPEDGFHASAWDERARPHWEILDAEPRSVITAGTDLAGVPLRKATFAMFDPAGVDAVVAAVTALGLAAGPAGSPRTPDLTYVNATHAEADKGRALAHAAAHLGVDLTEVAAIGDADNDLSMLAVAGTAIAMGQASEAVRAAAHLVVPSVDDDGVAVALAACRTWRSAAA